MELSLLLLEKILSMALMVLMGFAVVKLGAVKAGQSSLLSALTLYIIVPCMILSAFQVEWTAERLSGLLLALAAAVILHILYIAVTRLLGDKFHLDGIERASLIYSNGGNLIVPLVSSVLGEEYVFYCCAFIAFQTILLWIHLPGLLGGGQKVSFKKLLLNPNILAIVAGVCCFLLRVTFPPLIADTIDSVSVTIGPVAMFMIGMLMADTDLKATFTRLKYLGHQSRPPGGLSGAVCPADCPKPRDCLHPDGEGGAGGDGAGSLGAGGGYRRPDGRPMGRRRQKGRRDQRHERHPLHRHHAPHHCALSGDLLTFFIRPRPDEKPFLFCFSGRCPEKQKEGERDDASYHRSLPGGLLTPPVCSTEKVENLTRMCYTIPYIMERSTVK